MIKFFYCAQLCIKGERNHKMCRPVRRVCRTLEKPAESGCRRCKAEWADLSGRRTEQTSFVQEAYPARSHTLRFLRAEPLGKRFCPHFVWDIWRRIPMVDIVTRINNVVNGFVWGPFGLALLFCTGLWLSIRTGFFQFRRMGYWLRHTIGAIFTNKDITAHTIILGAGIAIISPLSLVIHSFSLSPPDSTYPFNVSEA